MSNQPDLPQNILTANDATKPGRNSLYRRVVRGWLRFSGPDVTRFSSSIEDQELLRRSRLLSTLFSLILVVIILVVPTAIPVPTYWIPVISLVVLGLLALMFNRMGQVTLSGIFYILAIDATLTILMITLPNGIRNSNIPDFDFFIIPTLIGGVVLPKRILPFLAVLHISIIVALFSLLPYDPLLIREIMVNQKGFAYSEISDALVIQIVGTTIAWLAASSVDRALVRASRAEELAEARKRLNEKTEEIVKQKQRLDYGISVLKEAQARFANGDYKARAKLQNNELASLAVSFNLMVERLNSVTQIAQEYTRLAQALQQLFDAQNAILVGGSARALVPTGTLADHIYPIFQRYSYLSQLITRSSSFSDKIRKELTQQNGMLNQLTSALAQTHALLQLLPDSVKTSQASSIQFIEKAQQLCDQISEQGKQCLQETRQLDQSLKRI
ncbi:MAG TPA: hypothetical protein VFB12_22700 [Ktedonobacteraceae bacterium]|nr:hypothetical protein [Ktedonobacteraceae bacterium]